VEPHAFWVYEIADEQHRDVQVGMASDLASRMRARWRATAAGGYPADTIPWLNMRRAKNPDFEPTFEFTSYPERESALAAEQSRRDALRQSGWFVSSDV
jgi:hypothetical protein